MFLRREVEEGEEEEGGKFGEGEKKDRKLSESPSLSSGSAAKLDMALPRSEFGLFTASSALLDSLLGHFGIVYCYWHMYNIYHILMCICV